MTWPVPPGGYYSAPYYQHYFGSYQYSPETATLVRQSNSPHEGGNSEFASFQQEITARMTYMYTHALKINPKMKSDFRVEKVTEKWSIQDSHRTKAVYYW